VIAVLTNLTWTDQNFHKIYIKAVNILCMWLPFDKSQHHIYTHTKAHHSPESDD